MSHGLILWISFNLFILLMLALDLGVFQRKTHAVSVKEALIWSAVWILLALSFNVFVYYDLGKQKALEFLTGYILEKSLSVDNIFVFVLLFGYFKVPEVYQHKVLFWGVLGALILRAGLIAIGAIMIAKFHWVIYLFGAFLVFTGFRMAKHSEDDIHPEDNFLIRLFRKFFPVTNEYHGEKFFIRIDGKKVATPLFIVLLAIEFTDLVFAFDSIPAIFAVTKDPFIVYTSNIFAILGLRSLYFALAGVIHRFHYLKIGLAMILIFIGSKMLMSDLYKVPVSYSLAVIGIILTASVITSLVKPKAEDDPDDETEGERNQ